MSALRFSNLHLVLIALVALIGASGCDDFVPGTRASVLANGLGLGPASDECTVPSQAGAWTDEVIALVNDERGPRGLEPLSANEALSVIAGDYACDMIEGGFFDHVNPITGETLGNRATAGDYDYLAVGENLAGGQLSPEEVVEAWMLSPGHRANILDEDFTEIGVAVRFGGDYQVYWVQEFGLPRSTSDDGSDESRPLPLVVRHAQVADNASAG